MCDCFEILGFQALTLLACCAARGRWSPKFGTARPHNQRSPSLRMDCFAFEDGTDTLFRNARKIDTPTPRSVREDGRPVCLL
jgi:hypothetical protein